MDKIIILSVILILCCCYGYKKEALPHELELFVIDNMGRIDTDTIYVDSSGRVWKIHIKSNDTIHGSWQIKRIR